GRPISIDNAANIAAELGVELASIVLSAAPSEPPLAAPPATTAAISNIPIQVPARFMGRDDELKAIDTALAAHTGRVAITALHGLRGVGKTVLAAAFTDAHATDYRAIWWIRAETESTMRADLVGLGVQLDWVAADDKEDPAVAAVLDRLRHDGHHILL